MPDPAAPSRPPSALARWRTAARYPGRAQDLTGPDPDRVAAYRARLRTRVDRYAHLLQELDLLDAAEVVERLRRDLRLGAERTSAAALLAALDAAATNYADAGFLAAAARDARERARLDLLALRGRWEYEARRELGRLRREAKEGFDGHATADFVEAWTLARSGEYKTLREQEQSLRAAVDALSVLEVAWKARLTGLQSQARLVATRSGPVPPDAPDERDTDETE